MSLQINTASFNENKSSVALVLSTVGLEVGVTDYTATFNGNVAGYLNPNLWDLVGIFLMVVDNDYRARFIYLDTDGINSFFKRDATNENGNINGFVTNLLLSSARCQAAKNLGLSQIIPYNGYYAPLGDRNIKLPFFPIGGEHSLKIYGVYNILSDVRKLDAVEKLPITLPFIY